MTSPNSPISEQRFARLLDEHGPEPEDWPLALRAGAARLLAESEPARAQQALARRLFECLGEDPERLEVPARLRARIAEIPLRHPRASRPWSWPFRSWYQPALGLAASLAAGLVLGLSWPPAEPESEQRGETLLADASAGTQGAHEEWQELAELAFGGVWLETE